MEDLRVYVLYFDREGYGESDPYPVRTVKSDAYDVQELADKLQIDSKFYVIGISMGAYPVYGCLKYILQRLSGASLVVPFLHYWWPCLPTNISTQSFQSLPIPFQRLSELHIILSPHDVEIIRKLPETPSNGQEKVGQQGVHESLHRDLIAGYAKWEFDPLNLSNPFPKNEGSVHILQGCDDRIFPVGINRFLADKIPWIRYHEIRNAGHFMIFKAEVCEAIIRALLSE